MQDSLSSFLKFETKQLHNEVEGRLNAHKLLTDEVTPMDYQKHIELLLLGHKKIDEALLRFKDNPLLNDFWPNEAFTELLKKDKAQFSISSHNEHNHELPVFFSNWQQALGALYVVNGASLGRKFIANKMGIHFKNWGLHPFFYTTDNKAFSWPVFKKNLDALCEANIDRQEVLIGAKQAFLSFV